MTLNLSSDDDVSHSHPVLVLVPPRLVQVPPWRWLVLALTVGCVFVVGQHRPAHSFPPNYQTNPRRNPNLALVYLPPNSMFFKHTRQFGTVILAEIKYRQILIYYQKCYFDAQLIIVTYNWTNASQNH